MNPHGLLWPQDFKSCVSTYSTIRASFKRKPERVIVPSRQRLTLVFQRAKLVHYFTTTNSLELFFEKLYLAAIKDGFHLHICNKLLVSIQFLGVSANESCNQKYLLLLPTLADITKKIYCSPLPRSRVPKSFFALRYHGVERQKTLLLSFTQRWSARII